MSILRRAQEESTLRPKKRTRPKMNVSTPTLGKKENAGLETTRGTVTNFESLQRKKGSGPHDVLGDVVGDIDQTRKKNPLKAKRSGGNN